MEIVVYALAFYVFECLAFAPAGSYAVLGLAGGLRRIRRDGFQPRSLWPAGLPVVAGALPFEVTPEGVHAVAPLRRFRLGGAPVPRSAPLSPGSTLDAAGALIRIDGAPFLRAASKEHAALLCELLRRLAAAQPAERVALAREAVRDALARAPLEAMLARVVAETRWVGRLGAALLVATLGLLVLSVVPAGGGVWAAALGALAALDAAALESARRAHRRLYPELAADRRELVAGWLLFPPALFRAREVLARRALGRFHPAAFAARLGDDARLAEVLRRELARLEHPPWALWPDVPERAARRAFLDACRDALLEFARGCGVPAGALLAPRPATTPDAASYCPACLAEYRRGFGSCSDCGVATRPCVAPAAA